MNMSVACLLEGRDLALVKSIINISNIGGKHHFKFVEQVELCHLLIAKAQVDGEIVYFAVDRHTKQKYEIKLKLTPKALRDMFQFMTQSTALAH